MPAGTPHLAVNCLNNDRYRKVRVPCKARCWDSKGPSAPRALVQVVELWSQAQMELNTSMEVDRNGLYRPGSNVYLPRNYYLEVGTTTHQLSKEVREGLTELHRLQNVAQAQSIAVWGDLPKALLPEKWFRRARKDTNSLADTELAAKTAAVEYKQNNKASTGHSSAVSGPITGKVSVSNTHVKTSTQNHKRKRSDVEEERHGHEHKRATMRTENGRTSIGMAKRSSTRGRELRVDGTEPAQEVTGSIATPLESTARLQRVAVGDESYPKHKESSKDHTGKEQKGSTPQVFDTWHHRFDIGAQTQEQEDWLFPGSNMRNPVANQPIGLSTRQNLDYTYPAMDPNHDYSLQSTQQTDYSTFDSPSTWYGLFPSQQHAQQPDYSAFESLSTSHSLLPSRQHAQQLDYSTFELPSTDFNFFPPSLYTYDASPTPTYTGPSTPLQPNSLTLHRQSYRTFPSIYNGADPMGYASSTSQPASLSLQGQTYPIFPSLFDEVDPTGYASSGAQSGDMTFTSVTSGEIFGDAEWEQFVELGQQLSE